MSGFKVPDLKQRRITAVEAKKALLEKFRKASDDPAAADRRAENESVVNARVVRLAQREAAKIAHEAELAAQAARDAETARQAQIEMEKAEAAIAVSKAELEAVAAVEQAARDAALAAEQKLARDERYLARKAAKKQRRKG